MWLPATTTSGYPLLTVLRGNVVGATTEDATGDGALFSLTPISRGGTEYV